MTDKKKAAEEAALKMVAIIYMTIEDAGEDGIPSGHLYSMLTGVISLETYQTIIAYLKRLGKITETFNLLKVKKQEG